MTRWKTKAFKMVNRPNEKDQINIIIKNFLQSYNSRLFLSPISSFKELRDCVARIEDPSIMGNWRMVRVSLQPRKHMEEEKPPLKHPIP